MNKQKALTIIYIILASSIIVLLSVVVYKQFELSKRTQAIEAQVISQKELPNNITRSENKYASKEDLEALLKKYNVNHKVISDDLDKMDAEIKSVNVLEVKSSSQLAKDVPSTTTGEANPQPFENDPYGILNKRQILRLEENFSGHKVPVGDVGFSAWKPQPWDINMLPRKYNVVTVEGIDENQRSHFYNKFTVEVDHKEYEVKIESAKTLQRYPEARFSWFNPKVFLGTDGGLNLNNIKAALGPNINISILSYGQYKKQPDISILQLGIGYELVGEVPEVVITPIAYNVGKHLPLIDNTYLAPSVHVDFDRNFSIMLGIRVGL